MIYASVEYHCFLICRFRKQCLSLRSFLFFLPLSPKVTLGAFSSITYFHFALAVDSGFIRLSSRETISLFIRAFLQFLFLQSHADRRLNSRKKLGSAEEMLDRAPFITLISNTVLIIRDFTSSAQLGYQALSGRRQSHIALTS